MGAIFTTFGIDWHLLLINAVNFGLLLAGLTYFLYKPLTKMLAERRERVTQGMADAEAAGMRLKEIEESRSQKLAEAGAEADSIISSARASGSEKAREIAAQAEGSAARTLADASAQAQEMKREAINESKEEVARMIVLGIEKLAKNSK
jgi:F-type H+-transporting ATPase subunit b